MKLTNNASVLVNCKQETVMTRSGRPDRSAEGDFSFSCSLKIWFRGFPQNALFVPEKLFWMSERVIFQVTSPKKVFPARIMRRFCRNPLHQRLARNRKKKTMEITGVLWDLSSSEEKYLQINMYK
jgi:hypothetical protein